MTVTRGLLGTGHVADIGSAGLHLGLETRRQVRDGPGHKKVRAFESPAQFALKGSTFQPLVVTF